MESILVQKYTNVNQEETLSPEIKNVREIILAPNCKRKSGR